MPRIAVIGSGVSGLAAARLLARSHDVVVFEADRRPGGHARTVDLALSQGSLAVDTGFIVYNEVNYPHLTRMFAELGIVTVASDMSFGVRVGEGELEYSGSSLAGVFAQPGNAFSPTFLKMLADILRFFREAKGVLDVPGDPSLGEYLDGLGLGRNFRDRFLVPMGAAIWSTPPAEMMEFPAKTFVRFFANHNLLQVKGQHPWRTVAGGSRRYVARFADGLGSRLRLAARVVAVSAQHGKVEIMTEGGHRDLFDEAVLACHADEALRLVSNPTPETAGVLSQFRFRDNEAVLHRDTGLMPRARRAWASWVYGAGGDGAERRVSVTYWMNRLQGLAGEPVFVSLNPDRPIRDDLVSDRHTFRHPVFSRAAVAAQARIPSIQGKQGLWFCGAWQRYGFHEDGIWSAVRIAEAKGVPVTWR